MFAVSSAFAHMWPFSAFSASFCRNGLDLVPAPLAFLPGRLAGSEFSLSVLLRMSLFCLYF